MVKIRARRFFSTDEIRGCTNGRVSLLLDRLADGYAALHKRGARSTVYALAGMALAMVGEARAGNQVLFEQFDASVHLRRRGGCYLPPPDAPLEVTLGGEPFWLGEDEEMGWMENALWDSFLIIADNMGDGVSMAQFFYDFADRHQRLAYRTQQLYRDIFDNQYNSNRDFDNQRISNQKINNQRISNQKINNQKLEIMVQVTNNFYGAVTINGSMNGDVHNPMYGSPASDSSVSNSSASDSSASDSPASNSSAADSPASDSPLGVSSMKTSPSVLSSDKAKRVFEQLVEIGVLDENFQPLNLSWSKKGMLAQQVSLKLGIENQWVTFGEFWHVSASSLRSGYNRGLDMANMGEFLDTIHPAIL